MAPRNIPLITGLCWAAAATGILYIWPGPDDASLWWLRSLMIGGSIGLSLDCLRVAIFASDARIRQITGDDPPVGNISA